MSMVSEPTPIASTLARTYCACRSAPTDDSERPLALDRDTPVETRRRLEDHEGPAGAHRGEKRLIQPNRRIVLHADVDLDAVRAQRREAAPVHQRKRIFHRGDDASNAGGDDALGAGSGPPGVRARLERAVQRRAASVRARLVERVDLRVRPAGEFVRALADHDAFVRDHARADDRVGRRPSEAAARMLDRPPHPPCVVYHLF